MFHKKVGRLLIIAAGGGCVAVLIFVALPMIDAPAPQNTQDEIVAEVLGTDKRYDDGSEEEVARSDGVMPRPSPPVGVWNDGREGAVVFRAAESETEGAGALSQEVIAADVPVKPIQAEESGLPQILSEQDVAEARAVLEGERSGMAMAVEPDVAAAVEPSEAVLAASGEEATAALVAPQADERPTHAGLGTGETDIGDGRDSEESVSVEPAPEAAAVEQLEAMVRSMVRAMNSESERTGVEDGPRTVARQAVRRGEFDLPVSLDSRARREVSHPSGGVPETVGSEAAQAGNASSGLPPRMQRAGVIVPGTLRGVMGYRLPLVSRQEVPDQIVSGVLIPAHTTFVIVKQGTWELVDLTAEEVQALREAAARQEREAATRAEAAEVEAPWTLWRALRGRRTPSHE